MKKLLYIILFVPLALFGQNTSYIEQNIPLFLPEGWGFIGFTCHEPQDVIAAFAPIQNNLVIVKDYIGNAYLPEWGFDGIGNLYYSWGYQIKLTEEITDFMFCTSIIPCEAEDCNTLLYGCTDASALNYDPSATEDNDSCIYTEVITGDTLFYYDCSNILYIADDDDYEAFEFMTEDFDEAVPAPYAEETDADILDYVSSFLWTYDRDSLSLPLEPNGDLTFDWDENPDPSVPDTAWYMTAYSWFTDATAQADNWLGMGPVTIPDEGAEFKFYFRGVSNWIDGFDLYVTTGGMEPYNDVDPGETDITYSVQGYYSTTPDPEHTIWTEHTVSLNDFAGESVYLTFHHHDTDMERLMLDNFLVVATDN